MTLLASGRTEFIRRSRAFRARHSQSDRSRPRRKRPAPRRTSIHTPFHVGRHLVSPLIRPIEGGRYAAAVSIRSGSGSMTHDRVVRFVRVFDTHEQAARFAHDEALARLGRAASEPDRITTPQE